MADAPAKTDMLTIEEYIRLYESEGAFELIHGERVQIMPPLAGHSYIVNLLYKLLMQFLAKNPVGEVFVEVPFVLPDTDTGRWVKGSRVPDVAFFAADRLKSYMEQTSDWQNKPFMIVPDLVVEVVSKNDSYSDVTEKVELYLQDGVRLIWVIDPHRRKVVVHEGSSQMTLSADDTLSGGEVAPDFSVSVGALFE